MRNLMPANTWSEGGSPTDAFFAALAGSWRLTAAQRAKALSARRCCAEHWMEQHATIRPRE